MKAPLEPSSDEVIQRCLRPALADGRHMDLVRWAETFGTSVDHIGDLIRAIRAEGTAG